MASQKLVLALLCFCLNVFARQDQVQALANPPSPEAAVVPASYRIGAGDILQITVWKEPDASVPSIVVRPDGKISLPVIKEVDVVGLTPAQLETQLTQRLDRFIHGAEVTVVVREIRSKKVYMVGAVRHEGPVRLDSPITVLQAINEAGGLTEYAKRKKIYVLRNENGQPQRLPLDYDAVLRGERSELNVLLQPGDTIVVPQ
jgi:polysaccharide export outer membrane protein